MRPRTGILVALLVLAAPGRAQEADVERELRDLAERSREVLHPERDPIRIVGRELGGNDFRGRAPALESATRGHEQVDTEALRDHKLALYTGAAPFHTSRPARRSTERGAEGRDPGARPSTPAEEDQDSGRGGGDAPVVAVLALAVAGLWVVKRRF